MFTCLQLQALAFCFIKWLFYEVVAAFVVLFGHLPNHSFMIIYFFIDSLTNLLCSILYFSRNISQILLFDNLHSSRLFRIMSLIQCIIVIFYVIHNDLFRLEWQRAKMLVSTETKIKKVYYWLYQVKDTLWWLLKIVIKK